ncbi:hypothetical protein, partial [Mannheimia indoligenes]|uniref:hypothetical protein n=1 Tax=Mannheimia indoligenes TaxID=3103145 RepID=UPI002FE633EE
MSKYTVKAITQNAKKTLLLSRGNITKIQAEESTKYQIFNEQGELVINPKVKKINEDDLAVYVEGEEQPFLILEDYYDVYPIEDGAYLADNSASLATSSREGVAITEVTSGISSKVIAYGLGAAALLGGVLALSGNSSGGGSAKLSKPSEPNKPDAPTKPIEPTKPV